MKATNSMYQIMTLSIFLLFSCSGVQQGESDKSEDVIVEPIESHSANDIIGTWRNLSMKVSFLDSDSIFDVPEGMWEQILKIKPIATTYHIDSTYVSKYFGLNDSLLFTTEGKWYLADDSLYLISAGVTTAYKFSKKNHLGEFVGILDWDEDGIANELYSGRQAKD